jgi:hypothetical protein
MYFEFALIISQVKMIRYMANNERSKISPKQYKYMTRYVTQSFNTLRKTVMHLGINVVTGGHPTL